MLAAAQSARAPLQNRSRHLLAIKEDVETKAELIEDLIKKIHTSTYTDVEQVLTFVDWLDQQLSTLSDETAVLKHFNWPERKADALREDGHREEGQQRQEEPWLWDGRCPAPPMPTRPAMALSMAILQPGPWERP